MLALIIKGIGGQHVLHEIVGPNMKQPVKHLRGFEVPQDRREARPYVSRDPLRKDICGGTVATEERSPGLCVCTGCHAWWTGSVYVVLKSGVEWTTSRREVVG